MRIRYAESLHKMKEKYEEQLRNLTSNNQQAYTNSKKQFNITQEDIMQIESELKALIYLVSLQTGYVEPSDGVGVYKPSKQTVHNLFKRYIEYLQRVYGVERNTKQTPHNKVAVKAVKCCYYYRFKFTLPMWVERLPEYIQSYNDR